MLRPDFDSVLPLEFDGDVVGAQRDFDCGFPVLPLVFVGAPEYFRRVADTIQAIPRRYGPSDSSWNSNNHYETDVFADGAMFADPRIGTGKEECVDNLDSACKLALSDRIINIGKMALEGRWAVEQTMLGFVLNTSGFWHFHAVCKSGRCAGLHTQ